jgi:hypothetical protein
LLLATAGAHASPTASHDGALATAASRHPAVKCTRNRRTHKRTCHQIKQKKKKKKHKPKRHKVYPRPPLPGSTVQSITPWKQDAAPVAWDGALERVVYNSLGTDGMFDAYSANPDGSDPQCLTCTLPSFSGVGTATNRGAFDVSPDGRYMLVTVERGDHLGGIGAPWTQPGKGGANDVWLYTTDGAHAWPLTDIDATGQKAFGTMWPRFDRTGNEIVWASMSSPALLNLGSWQLRVANIVWTNGVPSLADVRTIVPTAGAFYEPYGFTPDDSHILFASNAGTAAWYDTQIDTIATDGSGLTQLTRPVPGGSLKYNEFAFYTPGGQIVYGSTVDATSGGLDYWIMDPDGSAAQRMTYFNSPWSTEYLGYSVAGGLTFNPGNPNQFLAGVGADKSGEHLNAYMVNLNPGSSQAGLTAHFYSDQGFGHLVTTAVNDPSAGLDADASPAPGVPASDYSIRWTGGLTPPATGRYQLCVFANGGAQLLIGGATVANAQGQRQCAGVQGTAGRALAVEMDVEHGKGPAWAQLSWIMPGAPSPTVIPAADLSPATP